MRSELVALNSHCSLSSKCQLCDHLGYRSFHNQTDPKSKLKNVFLSKLGSLVVLPCSSLELENFDQIISGQEKSFAYVILFRKWRTLSLAEKEKLKQLKLAIVFDKIHQLKTADVPDTVELYLVLTRTSWNVSSWEKLDSPLKSKVYFFFPGNPYNKSNLFDAKEIFKITRFLSQAQPQSSFKTPFGHDLLDVRNHEHLDWVLSETKSFEANSSLKKPSISVIIPTYNRSALLKKVLLSLQRQKMPQEDFEILIIDDGGNDGTEQMIRKFSKTFPSLNIRYFFVPRNLSVRTLYNSNRAGPIRNLGAKKARGDLFLFLDSDILMPDSYLLEIKKEHQEFDVVVPKRIYLNKETSSQEEVDLSSLQVKDHMVIKWQSHLSDFYSTSDWGSLPLPWKYFMTYCLSVKKEIFLKSGGFRTNYISYGYEDLDWGFRVVQSRARLKYINREIFHLYHFDGESEYTLFEDFRRFQLAMTSRMFVAQNAPLEGEYLINMTRLRTPLQKNYFLFYSVLWKSFNALRKVKWMHLS